MGNSDFATKETGFRQITNIYYIFVEEAPGNPGSFLFCVFGIP